MTSHRFDASKGAPNSRATRRRAIVAQEAKLPMHTLSPEHQLACCKRLMARSKDIACQCAFDQWDVQESPPLRGHEHRWDQLANLDPSAKSSISGRTPDDPPTHHLTGKGDSSLMTGR